MAARIPCLPDRFRFIANHPAASSRWNQRGAGRVPSTPHHASQQPSTTPSNQVQFDAKGRELAPCGCLKRSPPPPPPSHPHFPLTPNNIKCLESWMLDTYASSAFNICPHQPLPKMTGLPPLRIHVKDDSVPV